MEGRLFVAKLLFTYLIADRAARLACGLARCLALAAAARLERFLHRRLVDRLDVFHGNLPLSKHLILFYRVFRDYAMFLHKNLLCASAEFRFAFAERHDAEPHGLCKIFGDSEIRTNR